MSELKDIIQGEANIQAVENGKLFTQNNSIRTEMLSGVDSLSIVIAVDNIPYQFGDFLARSWNGKDDIANPLPEGLYIWIIISNNEVVCNGTVVLAK